MAYSLANELKKIQIAKTAEPRVQRRPSQKTVREVSSDGGTSATAVSSGKPLSLHRARLHESDGSKKNQALLRIRVKPSPPSIPKPHELRRVKRLSSEELSVQTGLGIRLQADGDSLHSIEADCIKERSPGDGCFSESEAEDYDRTSLSSYQGSKSSTIEHDIESEQEILPEDDSTGVGECDSLLDQEEIDEFEDSCDGESVVSEDESLKSNGSVSIRQSASASQTDHRPSVRNVKRLPGFGGLDLHRKQSWVQEKKSIPSYPLLPSLFDNVPPTIYFTIEGEEVSPFPADVRKVLKWKLSTITPKVIKSCIVRSGFKLTKKNVDWIGYWGKHMKANCFKSLKEFQKLNHFPGTFQVGRKDRLWRNFSKMQITFGRKEFNFLPQTFVLPNDLRQLKKTWEESGHKQKWIIKPPASARGIGIKVIHKWSQLPRKRAIIVQRYLSKPYLINGSKFDIRVYVYVTSFDPLRLYVFDDGLVRFATSKYSSSSKTLSNKYMHLTNYSINKKNISSYTPSFDEKTCQGHKWSLKSLWQYLRKRGIDSDQVWESIKDIVVKTIICAEPSVNTMVKQNVKSRHSCHELFGFDIIFDEHLKPWLLEVNISPRFPHPEVYTHVQFFENYVQIFQWPVLCAFGSFFLIQVYFRGIRRNFEVDQMSAERIWFEHFPLTSDEKYKHAYFTQRRVDESVKSTILDLLTPDDIRILMESDDELSRCGSFQRVFPSTVTDRYLKYFDTPRYYNMLLDEWTKRYLRDARRPGVGIALLLAYSKQGLHLGVTNDPAHQWGPVRNQGLLPTRSISAPAQLLEEQNERTSASLPSIKKKKKPSVSSERSVEGLVPKKGHSITAQVSRKVSSILQSRTKL